MKIFTLLSLFSAPSSGRDDEHTFAFSFLGDAISRKWKKGVEDLFCLVDCWFWSNTNKISGQLSLLPSGAPLIDLMIDQSFMNGIGEESGRRARRSENVD